MDSTMSNAIKGLEELLDSLPKTKEERLKKINELLSDPNHRDIILTKKDREEIYQNYSEFLISKKEELQTQIEFLYNWPY